MPGRRQDLEPGSGHAFAICSSFQQSRLVLWTGTIKLRQLTDYTKCSQWIYFSDCNSASYYAHAHAIETL